MKLPALFLQIMTGKPYYYDPSIYKSAQPQPQPQLHYHHQQQQQQQHYQQQYKETVPRYPNISPGGASWSKDSGRAHTSDPVQHAAPQYVMVPGVGLVLIPSAASVPNVHPLYSGVSVRDYYTPMNDLFSLQINKLSPLASHCICIMYLQGMPVMKPAYLQERPVPRESADGYIYQVSNSILFHVSSCDTAANTHCSPVQVHFKHAQRSYLLGPSAPRHIRIGDFVKVEADRGEDLGVVCNKTQASEFKEEKPTAGFRGRGVASDLEDCKRITRLATEEERALLPAKAMEEMQILQVQCSTVQCSAVQCSCLCSSYNLYLCICVLMLYLHYISRSHAHTNTQM